MDSKTFIISLRCGRLSNRLILFANFIALAEEQGHRVINFTFHSYAHLFESTRQDIYCQFPAPSRRSLLDVIPGVAPALRKTRICYHTVRGLAVLNESVPLLGGRAITLHTLQGPPVTRLDGPEIQGRIANATVIFVYDWGFRTPELVNRHAKKIRAYFRPIDEIQNRSTQAVDHLRQRSDVVIGVHVRHGDYRTWIGGKYFFPASQYARWMRELAEQFPGRKVSFLICSDDPRSEMEFPGLVVGFGTGSPPGDQAALAGCDYVMGPPSTFSQWASFYGGTPLLHLYDAGAKPNLEKFAVSDLGVIPG